MLHGRSWGHFLLGFVFLPVRVLNRFSKNVPLRFLTFSTSLTQHAKHSLGVRLWSASLFIALSFLYSHPVLAEKALKPIKVQLSWSHQYQFAGFYAAKMQGYYEEVGLDVHIDAWQPGVNALDDVLSGKTDYATGYSSIVADYAKGKPIKLLMAAFQYSPMVLLSHKPVTSLADLEGGKVMHYGNLQVSALIDKANAVNSMSMEEIDSSGQLQDFIDHKVDFYAVYQTNEPYQLLSKGVPFSVVDPKRFDVQSYGDLIYTSVEKTVKHTFEVEDFKNATIKGWRFALDHPEKVVDYILSRYPIEKDRKALISEAELTAEYIDTKQVPIGHLDSNKLLSTAQQAYQAGLLTKREMDALDIHHLVYQPVPILLTESEKAYLKELPYLKVGNDFNWPPFDFINEDGEYDGIIADHIKWVANSLHIELKTLTDTPWNQILVDLKEGRLDVAPGAMNTPERRAYLDFTEPYMTFPIVLMARQDVGFVRDLEQLAGEKVAVPRGWYTEEELRTKYPKIVLYLVDGIDEGLEAVINRKADFYLGNLAAINYQIRHRKLTGLRVVSNVYDSGFLLTMGVTKGNHALRSILQKSLNAMPEAEKKRIYDRWINIQLVHQPDYSTTIKGAIIALTLIGLLTLLLFWVHRQKRKQDDYIRQLNELSMASYSDYKTRKLTWVSDSFLELTGYDRAEMLNNSHNILKHPDVDDEYYEGIYDSVGEAKVWKGEVRAQTKDGRDYWVDVTYTPDVKHHRVVGVWATRADITDKKRIEELAIIDGLTGVYNRNQFNELFDSVVDKASRSQSQFAMLMFDLDEFKKINDRFGHCKGDEVLVAVLDETKAFFNRGSDQIFRVGGEEFVVLTAASSYEGFANHIESYRAAIEGLNIPNPDSALSVVTVSIGAVYCENLTTMMEANLMYSYVDELLYKAKTSGRNRVELDPSQRYCRK